MLMRPEESFLALQKQELTKKFVEIGKVHLTWAILRIYIEDFSVLMATSPSRPEFI